MNLLTQLVLDATHIPRIANQRHNLLDLFLSSSPEKYFISVGAALGNFDHMLISAFFNSNQPHSRQPHNETPERTFWHYNSANWQRLNNFFNDYNWSTCYSDNINIYTERFTKVVLTGMKSFIPSTTKKSIRKPLVWFTATSKRAIQNKNKAFRIFKRSPSEVNKMKYVTERNVCNSTIRKEKHVFDLKIKNKINNNSKGSKGFWSLVKSINNNFNQSSIPTLKDHSGTSFFDSKDKANLLAKLFADNSNLDDLNKTPAATTSSGHLMRPFSFRKRCIVKVLDSLNGNQAPGPDGIPSIVLKKCSNTIAGPLCSLFFKCYKAKEYPLSWRSAIVQPIPKKGNKTEPKNYRPIAITSVLAKTMEKVINAKIMRFLADTQQLSDHQYGFRSQRSTGDLMTYVTHKWYDTIHKCGETKAVALDIAKAFDRVWHKGLMVKLLACGLSQNLCEFISSFLTNRSIRVVVDGVFSDRYELKAGVPQGSPLSPTLFLIFINDLLKTTHNPIHSFADDSTLHASFHITNPNELNSIAIYRSSVSLSLNDDLMRISDWGRVNLVDFNASKTQSCVFSNKKTDPLTNDLLIHNTTIENSPSLFILGTYLSENLLWFDHLRDISNNAARRLGFLRRCKRYLSADNILLIYKAFIRPILEFNSHIWAGAPASSISLIDRIQSRALKLVGNHDIIKLNSLENRRTISCLSLFYRYFHGFCSKEISEIMPPLYVRDNRLRSSVAAHSRTVAVEYARTNRFSNSFIPRTSQLWNNLPNYVFPDSYNLQKFKKNINCHFALPP